MHQLIKPFRALRPAPGRAQEVAAPPYDVVNAGEARALAEAKPWSFLHISRPEIDLPAGTDPYEDKVYEQGTETLQARGAEKVLIRDSKPGYYVYRLRMGDHQQTGFAFTGSIAAYDENRIRKHEFTRPNKENDRVRQISALNAQTGPVLVTYPATDRIGEILAEVSQAEPLYQVVGEGGVVHTVWMLDDTRLQAELTELVEDMGAVYIADGHHRSAAASRTKVPRPTCASTYPRRAASA